MKIAQQLIIRLNDKSWTGLLHKYISGWSMRPLGKTITIKGKVIPPPPQSSYIHNRSITNSSNFKLNTSTNRIYVESL